MTPRTAARQASLSCTISRSLLKLMFTESDLTEVKTQSLVGETRFTHSRLSEKSTVFPLQPGRAPRKGSRGPLYHPSGHRNGNQAHLPFAHLNLRFPFQPQTQTQASVHRPESCGEECVRSVDAAPPPGPQSQPVSGRTVTAGFPSPCRTRPVTQQWSKLFDVSLLPETHQPSSKTLLPPGPRFTAPPFAGSLENRTLLSRWLRSSPHSYPR